MFEGVAYFTEGELADPVRVAQDVLRMLGAPHIESIYEQDPSFDLMEQHEDRLRRARLQGPAEFRSEALTATPDELGFDLVGTKVPIEALGDFWERGKCLGIFLPYMKPLCKRFAEASRAAFEPATRGECALWPEGFEIGGQDMWVKDRHGSLVFRARPTFRFGFFPAEAPLKPTEYATKIFEVPVMKDLKRDLEVIVGPLRQFAYWSGIAEGW